MNYSMLYEVRELADWSQEGEALSIYHALSSITDRRKAQGKRYSLAVVLTCVLLAKLAGETTLQGITEWIRYRGSWLHEVLPLQRESFPCAATYSNTLRAVDPEEINEVLMNLLTRVRSDRRVPQEQRHVVLDGKTLRGTQHHLGQDQRKMHHLNHYESHTGLVLKEQMVAEKEQELTRVGTFLTPVLMKGRLVSADALFTQRHVCQQVVAAGGDYLLFVKHNQPTLYQDLALFFEEPPSDCRDWRSASSTNKGHGRLEQRDVTASNELNDFLARDWFGIGQVFRLRRRVQHALVCTQHIVYGITSVTSKQADASQLLELARGHWAIENRLHYRRDVTLGEDACQVRKGSAPHALAVLNSFVLGLLDFWQVSNAKQFLRLLDAQPFRAVRLLFTALAEN